MANNLTFTCGTGDLKYSANCPEVPGLKADSCKVHGPDLAHSQCLVYVGNCDCHGSAAQGSKKEYKSASMETYGKAGN